MIACASCKNLRLELSAMAGTRDRYRIQRDEARDAIRAINSAHGDADVLEAIWADEPEDEEPA